MSKSYERQIIESNIGKLIEKEGVDGFSSHISVVMFQTIIVHIKSDLLKDRDSIIESGVNIFALTDGMNYLKAFYEVEIGSLDRSLEKGDMPTYYEAQYITKQLSYIVLWFYKNKDNITYDSFSKYMIFRRKKAISFIVENPPRFNSTSIMNNIQNMSNNSGLSNVIQKVFEPFYNVFECEAKSFDSFGSMFTNFGNDVKEK